MVHQYLQEFKYSKLTEIFNAFNSYRCHTFKRGMRSNQIFGILTTFRSVAIKTNFVNKRLN